MVTGSTAVAPSSPLHLENLPSLVLEYICQYLAQCDARRYSLFAFSLASKRCCAIAASQRFERIKLDVRGRLELRQDLEKWSDILEVEGRARHVRRIKVVGYMPPFGLGKSPEQNLQRDAALTLAQEWKDEREYEGYKDNFTDPPRKHIAFNSLLQWASDGAAKQSHNESWQPLARFISTLPALKDVVYSCLDQVAPCLLRAVHQHHPNSRLHVHTFSLRSLYQMKDNLHDIDPDEFMLATSPCLFAIALCSSTGYDTYGYVDYHNEALFAMVSGMAPRLKHVRLLKTISGASRGLEEAVRTPRPPWRGFFQNRFRARTSLGRLTSLALDGEGTAKLETLLDWGRHIDLSKLCSLEMSQGAMLEEVQAMALIAESGRFRGLRKLSLKVLAFDLQKRRQLDAAITQLLEHLHGLVELEMTSYCGPSSFSVILKHHGKFLYELRFMPERPYRETTTSLTLIEAVLEHCPNLRGLSLTIPRTKGDGQELAMYRALARFPHLRQLSLTLECSSQRWDELGLNLPPVDLVRDILINAAVDASLARSIFLTISDAKSPTSPPLETLKVSVYQSTFTHVWDDYDFGKLIGWIGRSWMCCRYPRDDHGGEVTTDEIQARLREMNQELMDEDWELGYGHGLIYEKVWKELWPTTTGNWMNDWKSFPLVGEHPDATNRVIEV